MTRLLYDLAAADETLRFSPYCWRIKLALAHKNLAFETTPWRFTEKEKISFSGQGKVPVLVDGETTIFDSQQIAEYLESAYPNEASLFGESPARPLTNFIRHWTERTLHPLIAAIILPEIFPQLHADDKAYFRASREKFYGMKIEDFSARRAENLAALNAALTPLRITLQTQDFIAGAAPAYADHIVFGALQWGRLMATSPLLAPDDPLLVWMDAVLETYGLTVP